MQLVKNNPFYTMKTILFLFLLVATTTAFSQGKYINKNEYQKVMKSFEGETKASRGQVIVAMEEWMNSQKQFVQSQYLSDNPWRGEEENKYIINEIYTGLNNDYKAFILATFDPLRDRAYFNKDTIIPKEEIRTFRTIRPDEKGVVSSKEVTELVKNEFVFKFETYTQKNGKTFFKVSLKKDVWGSYEEGSTLGTAYLGATIKEIQDFIYKKVGK